jgi:N-acetyl-gamma-glutamyl-phosphate reductase
MKAAIVGAGGYAGQELQTLLARHPSLDCALPMRGRAQSPAEGHLLALDLERLGEVDLVFLCTPHGAAAPLARVALEAGAKVVDLSADFRLKDPAVYEATYGAPHPAPDLLDVAVYGLTEHNRREVSSARLVANPGCYPTSVLMPLLPLLEAGLLEAEAPIIADAKSGVSGAGAGANATTHFGNVHDNLRAYGIGDHRHTPEIWQAAGTDRIVFVPHLLPCFRGILTTLYLTPRTGIGPARAREVLQVAYAEEPFVEVLPPDTSPTLHDVQHTNQSAIGVHDAYGQLVVVSTLDNLVKGAAGQALQNANLMLGLEEGLGLA